MWCEQRLQGSLYVDYGSGSISLTRCPRCGEHADPFVEHEWVLLYLNLALLKPPVFRHVLLNEAFPLVRLVRMSSFLVLVELYLRVRQHLPSGASSALLSSVLLSNFAAILGGLLLSFLLLHVFLWLFACQVRGPPLGAVAAFLMGSLVPKSLHALTAVWDYSQLPHAPLLLELLLFLSRFLAFSCVLPTLSSASRLALTILVRLGI